MKDNLEHTQAYIATQQVKAPTYTKPRKLVLGSILAAVAAILQSAGIFVGFGYAFSILATLPIALAAMISLRIGLMSYFITILLLVMLQPSELFIFPFTTGLLGVILGAAMKWWNHWIAITIAGGIGLTTGILLLLYVLKFPILGPAVSHSFNYKIAAFILLFSLLYSVIWLGVSKKVFRFIFRTEHKRK